MAATGTKARELTPEELQRAIASNIGFVGATPTSVAAYNRDPRQALSKSVGAQATNFTPVTGGIAEGLSRLGSGFLANKVNSDLDKKYALLDQAIADPTNRARMPGETPAPVEPVTIPNVDQPIQTQVDPTAAAQIAQAMGPTPNLGPPQGPPQAPPPQAGGAPPPNPPQPPVNGRGLPGGNIVGAAPQAPPPPPPQPPLGPQMAPQGPASLDLAGGSASDELAGGAGADQLANAPARVPKGQPAVALAGNNPGGLNDGDFARSQPGYVGGNGRYAAFRTVQDGFNAQKALLRSYIARGYDTPIKIAKRWAPAEDGNKPGSYAQTIAKQLGIGVDDKVTRQMVQNFATAQAGVENSGFNKAMGGGGADTLAGGDEGDNLSTSVDVPDMPLPPDAPKRPAERERIRSERLALAKRILEQNPNMRPDLLYAATNDLYQKGYDEDFESQKQAYETEAALDRDKYREDLQGYRMGQDAIRNAQIAERTAAQKFGYDTQLKGIEAQYDEASDLRDLTKVQAVAAAKNPGGRQLPAGINKTISSQSNALSRLKDAMSTFKPDYFNAGIKGWGQARNTITNVLSSVGAADKGDEDRVAWWKNFNSLQNIDRHELFGSALSAAEAAAWDAASVNEGTSAAIAARNLKIRYDIAKKHLGNSVNSAVGGGYNTGQIEGLVGNSLTEGYNNPALDEAGSFNTRKAKTAAGQPRKTDKPEVPTVKGSDGKTYKLINGQWVG